MELSTASYVERLHNTMKEHMTFFRHDDRNKGKSKKKL